MRTLSSTRNPQISEKRMETGHNYEKESLNSEPLHDDVEYVARRYFTPVYIRKKLPRIYKFIIILRVAA